MLDTEEQEEDDQSFRIYKTRNLKEYLQMNIYKHKNPPYYCVDFEDSEGTTNRLPLKTKDRKIACQKAPMALAEWNNKREAGLTDKPKKFVRLSRLLKEVYRDSYEVHYHLIHTS